MEVIRYIYRIFVELARCVVAAASSRCLLLFLISPVIYIVEPLPPLLNCNEGRVWLAPVTLIVDPLAGTMELRPVKIVGVAPLRLRIAPEPSEVLPA